MNMSKDLVILGSYPSTDKTKTLLKECISSLGNKFDIMVSTHYPVDFETQTMIKYYIYDHRNELIFDENIYIYADCNQFYYQGYIDGTSTHPSFSIYRSIINSLKFAKNHYDYFYYIESDSIFSPQDVQKLLDIGQYIKSTDKVAWFFEPTPTVLNSNIFYSNINWFLSIYPDIKNSDEYKKICLNINSFGILEDFLYKNLNNSENLENIHTVKNIHFTQFFDTSRLSLNSYREDGMDFPFELRLVKVENSNNIAYVYANDNFNNSDEYIEFSINNVFHRKLPTSKTYMSEILNLDEDIFMIRIGNYVKKYTKDEILKSKSFVRFK